MLKNRNILLVLILTIILISIFFIKSSNIQVDSNIKNYTIKCQNCFEYKDTVLSFFDSFRIEVSATGYQTEEFNLSHNDGLNFISLKPNKIKIQFMYDIKPNKVEFLINDIKREFTDEISLVPGDYKIKIISENYYTFEDAITLEASDEIFTINLSDKLIAKNVKFQNSNENIYVLNGSTKIENDAIYQLNKKSTIISHKKNNNVIEYELNIVDNKTEIINLDNIFKNQSIGISIETIPVGAAIRINNTYRGLSPLVINEEEIDKLEISAAGYEDYISTDDNLINDNSIFIELDKILAKVNIKSSPQSDIYINNNYISSTPVSIQLPVGQYNLSLRKKGYATIEKKIIIENRFELTYEEKLLTIKQHALAISPKKYKNQKGIDLILMDPGELMLGSPENEKRRSRNEIQRSVSITKHFYASKHLISEKIYESVMNNNSSNSMLPKVNVKWIEAATFANKLSELEGLDKFYEINNKQIIGVNEYSNGYRLLTESEWELCASKDYNKTVYPWGNVEVIPPLIGNLAGEENIGKLKFYVENYRDDFVKRSDVGTFNENKNGFTDLVGNVSEWVNDFYSEDFLTSSNETFINYLGPTFGNSHVVKGSNYETANQTELGISYRAGVIGPSELIGFRVARWIY